MNRDSRIRFSGPVLLEAALPPKHGTASSVERKMLMEWARTVCVTVRVQGPKTRLDLWRYGAAVTAAGKETSAEESNPEVFQNGCMLEGNKKVEVVQCCSAIPLMVCQDRLESEGIAASPHQTTSDAKRKKQQYATQHTNTQHNERERDTAPRSNAAHKRLRNLQPRLSNPPSRQQWHLRSAGGWFWGASDGMSEKEEMPVEEVPGEPNEVKEASAETAVTDETSESLVKDETAKESTEEPESTKSTAADADEGHRVDREVVPVGLCKPYLQTLEFVVPDGAVAGQEIPVKTPTGMVNAVVPEGQQPGDRCAMEVPVPGAFVLTVPDGAVEGATFSFEECWCHVQCGGASRQGDQETPFTVGSQPPEGTEPLQKVFQHYASLAKAALRKASHLFDPEPTAPMIAMAHAVPPQEITFIVPDGVAGGELITVQGPVGPLVVTVPEGRKAGDEVSAPLCPPSEGFTVTVPEGVGRGRGGGI